MNCEFICIFANEMSRKRKIGCWIAGIVLTPVVLVVLLVGALYLPPVQQWAAKKVCQYASEQTGLDISIERLRITPLLDLDLQGFLATTPPDTIADVRHLIVDLKLSRLLSGHIGIESLNLKEGTLDTRDLIATTRVRGKVGSFLLNSDDISLSEHRALLSGARLDECDVDISLRDTTVVDTTESAPIVWSIGLGDIEAYRTRVAFHTVGDTICVQGSVRQMVVKGGDVDLEKGIYRVDQLLLDADSLRYDHISAEPRPLATRRPPGLDPDHILCAPLHLRLRNLVFKQEKSDLSLELQEMSGSITDPRLSPKEREENALQVDELTGNIRLDDTHIQVPNLHLRTPETRIDGNIDMDWSSLSVGERGTMDVDIDAEIGTKDIAKLMGGSDIMGFPYSALASPIILKGKARGNVDCIQVENFRLEAPPVANAQLTGTIRNVLDSEQLDCDLDVNMQSADLRPLHRMLGLSPSIRLPKMNINGKARMKGSLLDADLRLQQGRGTAHLKGNYDTKSEKYDLRLNLRNLNISAFLPNDSLYEVTGKAHLRGRGTDIFSNRFQVQADVDIDHLRYGHNDLDNLQLRADVRDRKGQVTLNSENDVLRADACSNFIIGNKGKDTKDMIKDMDISLGVSHINLYALGIVKEPLAVSMVMQLDGQTNLSDSHHIEGTIRAIELTPHDTIFYPTDVWFSLNMEPEAIAAKVTSGDMEMEMQSHNGLDELLDKVVMVTDEVKRQLAVRNIDQDTLKSMLPDLNLRLRCGRENTLASIVQSLGYTYDRLHLDLNSNPRQGINADGYLHALNTGSIQLDTIQWQIYQDSTDVLRLGGRVRNGPKNKQVVFESNVNAKLTPQGADATIDFRDAKGLKGVDLGAQIKLEEDGYRLHLSPLNPIIAYRRFTLNPDNYIHLSDSGRVEADIDLLADDGTGFKLYSTPNPTAVQDVTLSVHDFNLGELSAVIPYMPSIEGILGGDFHLVQERESMSVLVDAQVNDLAYEGARMGTVGLNAVYLPNSDGTHYVDGIVSHEGLEVATLVGTYDPKDEGTIDAQAQLLRLPLTLANGFIPDQTAMLMGYATGEMTVKGNVSQPIIDGQLATDSMCLVSDMYSLNLRFPNDTIGVRKSHLSLNRIEAYSTGRNPLVLDGTIDLRDLDRIGLNLSLSARNFELINAPKSHKAVAYGKVYVNIGARLTGTLNDMLLRGRLDVLGNTDVTYVLTDSPLTVEDELAELVTFVDFSDTLAVEELKKESPQNIDMQMDISIEQATQVHCLLSIDGTNHIDLEGGGDLTMSYTTQDGLQLFGRYTIVSGLMNYTLMVMSLKNFMIQNGSYAEFTGDVLNPRLSIHASERVKTTVYENNVPRSVNFDVGLSVSQTLDDMGLEFTLEAPGDMSISNQLAAMTTEERGKVAVTMLATGMYLTESGNGTSGFSATNALNSFLQTQIAAISNKALSSIDLNFGIDNTNTASGGMQTDYSFSFAKRFWDNRISLIVGGKVSSGSEAENSAQSIINNISIEYRLDKGATRYVRLYYDRDTESLLEGDIMEMGAGVVLRKKSNRLGELFMFRKRESSQMKSEE